MVRASPWVPTVAWAPAHLFDESEAASRDYLASSFEPNGEAEWLAVSDPFENESLAVEGWVLDQAEEILGRLFELLGVQYPHIVEPAADEAPPPEFFADCT
jgi:hypothetical protein